jgi:hypothetical protein
MNKKGFKKECGQCAVCDEPIYSILDVHRIEAGGKYNRGNCVTLCCKCHRLHHAGKLNILEKRYSTAGWVLFLEINNELKIKPLGNQYIST